MKSASSLLAMIVLLGAVAVAGYWIGRTHPASEARQTPPAGAAVQGPKVLYYRNPMGLPDTSPVPKKDSMGMDYIAVYEGEEPAGPELKISLDRVQKLGVRTETVVRRELSRTVRAVGTLQVNERLEHTVAPRFEGWIQTLFVATTGESVRRGQPLMEVYSPELITAQQEYIIALQGRDRVKDADAEIQANMKNLADSSLQRLGNWEISEAELQQLRAERRPRQAVTLRSPVDGVVMAKPSVKGMRFMPGEALYRIADLSSLWLLADVFEQELAWIASGQDALVRVNAYPDKTFRGKVAFVYPTVNAETRTARVRVELPNPGRLLRPDMYASVEVAVRQRGGKRLAVSDSAVLDGGARQVVLVQREEGRFEPREVKLGQRGDGFAEVVEGLKEGETVVVAANFLIDSESNLKAAVAGFTAAAQKTKPITTHAAEGTVEAIDPQSGSATVAHGPVASLNWPGMTMEFKVKDGSIFAGLKPGAKIAFDFTEQAPGEWAIVRAAPLSPTAASVAQPAKSGLGVPARKSSGGVSGAHVHEGH